VPTFLDPSLFAPNDGMGRQPRDVSPSPAAPQQLRDMGGVLNDGLLVAEALGIDATEARIVIDQVWELLTVVGSHVVS
jgi:hypothetical protein